MSRQLLQLLRDNATRNEAAPAISAEIVGTDVHLYVYDVIDAWWGVGADMLLAALADAGGAPVHLHINSPGGDVFEARAMCAALVAYQGKVTAHVDGIAASLLLHDSSDQARVDVPLSTGILNDLGVITDRHFAPRVSPGAARSDTQT